MSDVYVFLGPALAVAAARAELDAVYLPPVSAGAIYRLWRLRPRAIGIIDGYFQHVPAVSHKEIMWIIKRGVHVFGGAGLGALRAVELEAFGMRGAGWVYQAFKDGTLDQDDEVAVAHANGSDGYRALSEPMVSIRQTLHAARQQNVISETAHNLLSAAAKAFFYPDRNWTALLQAGHAKGVDLAELAALRQWLPRGRIDQMASDAVSMLQEMRRLLATDPAPQRVCWHLANTVIWDAARRQWDGATGDAAITDGR